MSVTETYDGLFELAAEARALVDQKMAPHLGQRTYDEVAILTFDECTASLIIAARVLAGARYFNRSDDCVVDTENPDRGEFHYHPVYRFLQDNADYRIELMTIDEGISPAHEALVGDPDIPLGLALLAGERIVHVSYKPGAPGIEGYEAEMLVLERAGLELVQDCVSNYGRFSYWSHPDLEGLYLKPRVNLRDPADADPERIVVEPLGEEQTEQNDPLHKVTEEQILTSAERQAYLTDHEKEFANLVEGEWQGTDAGPASDLKPGRYA